DAGGLLAAEPARDLDSLVQGHGGRDVGAADELEGGEAEEVQVDPRQARQPPVLRGARDQAVDALERRAHTVDQLAREGPRLGVLGRVEVLPEEAQAGRLRRSVVEQIDLVERLEGQLARGSTRSHRQNFCTARRTCTISSAVTAASYPLLPASPPARASACSMVSVVSTPNATGRSWPRATAAIPLAASPATKSKCGVSPRTTAPRHTSAS